MNAFSVLKERCFFLLGKIVCCVKHHGHDESERDLIFQWKMSIKTSLPFSLRYLNVLFKTNKIQNFSEFCLHLCSFFLK